MKKTSLLTALFLMFAFMGFAQEWHGITSDSPATMKKTLISSTENETVIEVSLGGFYTQNLRTPEGKKVAVSLDKMASELEAGAPQLSYDVIPVMIGDMAEMEVNVVKSTYVDFENVEVAPSKGNFSRQINPEDVPYTYGEMYQQDAFWPAAQATLNAPYIIRDFRGQNIVVRPFAYNPVTKTLRVYTNMTIAMTKVSDNGENQKAARKSNTVKVTPETKAAYEHRFINFAEGSKAYPFQSDSNGEMLVICADQYMAGMQDFVAWKNKSGRPTTMVSVSEVGGNSDTQMKAYITNIYNDPTRNLTYVLLVGDYADITPHSVGSDARSDNWLGQIEGSDHYPEIFVGRFSVQTDAQVATHVNKVIGYERDVQAGAWAGQGLGIGAIGAGSGHYGEDDYVHIDFIRDTLLHYGYTTVTDLHEGGGASASSISNTINQGVGVINYCNHGSETSWGVANYSNSNVHALTNDNMLPIVWSVACLNGKFNYGSECFAEAWLRATDNTTGQPTGAIGGMFSWISQPWIPPMYGQDEMVAILTEWVHTDEYYHTLGGTSLNGSMAVIDKSGSSGYETHDTWLLFGDPSMMVRTANPTEMDVTINPAAPMIGMSTLAITTDAPAGIATLSTQDGEVLASGQLVNGAVTLEFTPFDNVGTFDIVIIGYNKVTYTGTIEVLPAEGAYISLDAFTPGTVPVAEEQNMSMTFKNVGVDPTTGETNIVLTSSDPNITFSDNEGSFGVLGANETITLEDEFAFTVASGVADGTMIQIDVTATCGSDVWTGKAKIIVGAPIIEFNNFQGISTFVPGQVVTVAANFKNNGHYMATNAVVTASTSSSYVTFESTTAQIGTIDPDGTASSVFTFTIAASCPTTEVINLDFVLNADNGVTATGAGVLQNVCNVVFNLSDSWGDGWNGNYLTVAFSDGTSTQNLTIDSGSSASYTLAIGLGVHVTLGWTTGNYTNECSFTVAYEGGDQITSGSNLSSSYHFEFDVDCAGEPIVFEMVQNPTASVAGSTVTLTWDAPAAGSPVSYIVKRNGVEVAELTELTYVDENLQNGEYTYNIIVKYAQGESMPAVVTAVVNVLGIAEDEVIFGIYPNPAENVLNIDTDAPNYEYMIVNSIGQVVVNGKAEGKTEVNVSMLNSGVYFIKVVANGNANIQKVIIK